MADNSLTDANNPLLAEWRGPFGLPPFSAIEPNHFRPAFERALAAHDAEIDAIAGDTEPATFANTILPLERAGEALDRVSRVFRTLASAHTNAEIQAIEREMSPILARHASAIAMNAALFARVDAVWAGRGALAQGSEEARVLELTHRGFVRAGAMLAVDDKKRLAEIMERLAALGVAFSQNVLADETSFQLVLESEADMAGMSEAMHADAAQAAAERGLSGKHVVTLARSSVESFLQSSDRRDLRKAALEGWSSRGEHEGPTDNRAIIAETIRLRAERAGLLGFATFAHFKLDNTMAKTPEAVRKLLEEVWAPACARAGGEREVLQRLANGEGLNDAIEAQDWRYYAEKERRARYAIDDSELKPYFSLDNMIAAAFYTAGRLFGLRFEERAGLDLHHPDARAFEVFDREGRHVALFIGDYFARASKRSGAWMSGLRDQHKLAGDVRPLVYNVANFSKPAAGRPALLSLDDARTLFHEFGHALHGMLSDVTYPRISGTSVLRDFVELPSQLFEHWLMEPQILRRFARHAETGEPISDALIARVQAARNFNQGFATVEYTASAIVDLDLHLQRGVEDIDVVGFERETLARIDMPKEILMRHRTPHFSHIFSGDGYSAGYYSYLWSEVLDSDAFEAFEEAGDPFDPAVAERLLKNIYAAGGRYEPDVAYRAFRGRLPSTAPLLRKRGLAPGDDRPA